MKIGRFSYISGNTNVTAPLQVGSFTSIANRVEIHNLVQHASVLDRNIVTNSAFRDVGPFPLPLGSEEPVIIGNDVWIGQAAVILGPVKIGDGAIVGAYAVVAKDIEPYSVVVGNPVKVIRKRFTDDQIKLLLKIKWWDWELEEIKKKINDFKDINTFLKNNRV